MVFLIKNYDLKKEQATKRKKGKEAQENPCRKQQKKEREKDKDKEREKKTTNMLQYRKYY